MADEPDASSARRDWLRYCRQCRQSVPAEPKAAFCSDACRSRSWRQNNRHRAEAAAHRAGATAACPECSATWTCGLEHPASTIYCSAHCRTRGWRRRSIDRADNTTSSDSTRSLGPEKTSTPVGSPEAYFPGGR